MSFERRAASHEGRARLNASVKWQWLGHLTYHETRPEGRPLVAVA
jgi:hypothetical protein